MILGLSHALLGPWELLHYKGWCGSLIALAATAASWVSTRVGAHVPLEAARPQAAEWFSIPYAKVRSIKPSSSSALPRRGCAHPWMQHTVSKKMHWMSSRKQSQWDQMIAMDQTNGAWWVPSRKTLPNGLWPRSPDPWGRPFKHLLHKAFQDSELPCTRNYGFMNNVGLLLHYSFPTPPQVLTL